LRVVVMVLPTYVEEKVQVHPEQPTMSKNSL
jgi:uncharacterized short protein YbdD (DUF466 family)